MPNVRILKSSFSGGEISRELFGRLDISKVQNSLDTCKNFIVMPHGVAANRPGFQFVSEVKNSANFTRLINFSFSSTQTFAIELGAGYFRFHTLGATVVSAGVPYEVLNSYAQSHIKDIHYTQSSDVLTLVHPSYPPMELKRLGNTNWTFTPIVFEPQTVAPTGVIATATYPTIGVQKTFKYKVTALNSLGFEESPASTVSNAVINDLTIDGNFNTITWTAVTGSIRYNVYKYSNGSFGYIGQTSALSFIDDNIIADLTHTLSIIDTVFSSANNYPGAVTYYEQRRFFAGTNNQPQNIWATQSSSDYNMSYSIPTQASDALRFKIAALHANNIKHILPGLDLIAMTPSNEWRISATSGALSATDINIKSQAQNGCNNVQPVIVNNMILYGQAQGGHIREMSYQWQNGGYITNDLCLLAPHLFDFNSIEDMAFSRAPTPVVWCINTAGELLGLTYVPEQEVAAWHKHTTHKGRFESCVAISENNADVLYVIVQRTVNGDNNRYIELLHTRNYAEKDDAFFVDSGLTYDGAETTTISGLSHLDRETVSILADGSVITPQEVIGGAITLPVAAKKVHVGLPIVADIVTAPAYTQQDATLAQSRVKNINKAWIRVFKSGLFSAGPNLLNLTPIKPAYFPYPDTAEPLVTDEVSLFITPSYNQSGQIAIRQSDPLPLTIVDVTIEVALGG